MSLPHDIAIRVEHLSKMYRLGTVGMGTLGDDLNMWWHNIRGRANPYAQVGEENRSDRVGSSDYVWALRDVNFEVKKGEIMGIIGKNGAGKSTLLKILSRITGPSEGRIIVNGRMASLLEVGTGFHPELTGRENIFLNGAILGMNKREIRAKFDEIVDFSGCARYVDTPVKRYSSGMTVRLGFAVAAFLEPEILVVDEVLAVGDAEFQKKCLGKMQDVSTFEGRTVLFVSHNMAAVKTICNNGIVLANGSLIYSGTADAACSYYLKGNAQSNNYRHFNEGFKNSTFQLHEVSVNRLDGTTNDVIDEFDAIEISTSITFFENPHNLFLAFVLNDETGNTLFAFSSNKSGVSLVIGENKITCRLPEGFLNVGRFFLSFYIIQDSKTAIFIEKDIIQFEVEIGAREFGSWFEKEPGYIKPKFNWFIK